MVGSAVGVGEGMGYGGGTARSDVITSRSMVKGAHVTVSGASASTVAEAGRLKASE